MRIKYYPFVYDQKRVDAFSRSKNNSLFGNVYVLDIDTLDYKVVGSWEAKNEEEVEKAFKNKIEL